MDTATHYTGNLRIRTRFNDDWSFSAWIYVDDNPRRVARLDGMKLPRMWGQSYDCRKAHEEMASSAISFEGAGLWSPCPDEVESYERDSLVEAAGGYPTGHPESGETVMFPTRKAMTQWESTFGS